MPNGRSGGFLISASDLRQLVAAAASTVTVGDLTTGSQPSPATASELLPLLHACEQGPIAVEEQDRLSYVVHISNEPIVWLLVRRDSAVFDALRQRHAQWLADHPGWHGWVGF